MALFSIIPQNAEVVVCSCSVKKVFLEISQNSQENTCARVSVLTKLQAHACNFIKKETLPQDTLEHLRTPLERLWWMLHKRVIRRLKQLISAGEIPYETMVIYYCLQRRYNATLSLIEQE